ncbi:hypothetical protein F511_08810 [Dorcoceras hygrometricum]|uniref:Uncharacterized protein n=1 Tax=Dorcoceras hygrometricum TaxID=472368 RepID=A0A2Z7BWB0_9LAMI|nr:hypothetical protein F511_08810 [Dorcoceras hygrometricum]
MSRYWENSGWYRQQMSTRVNGTVAGDRWCEGSASLQMSLEGVASRFRWVLCDVVSDQISQDPVCGERSTETIVMDVELVIQRVYGMGVPGFTAGCGFDPAGGAQEVDRVSQLAYSIYGQFQESDGQNEDPRSVPLRGRGRRVEDEVDDLAVHVDSMEIVIARFQRMSPQVFNGDESSADADSWLQHITGCSSRCSASAVLSIIAVSPSTIVAVAPVSTADWTPEVLETKKTISSSYICPAVGSKYYQSAVGLVFMESVHGIGKSADDLRNQSRESAGSLHLDARGEATS